MGSAGPTGFEPKRARRQAKSVHGCTRQRVEAPQREQPWRAATVAANPVGPGKVALTNLKLPLHTSRLRSKRLPSKCLPLFPPPWECSLPFLSSPRAERGGWRSQCCKRRNLRYNFRMQLTFAQLPLAEVMGCRQRLQYRP